MRAFALVAVVVLGYASLVRADDHPLKEAYFGETHVHTSWSFDAYIFGNHMTGPADAYKYAKGQTIKHPIGYDIKITTPLDWMGVTDHSEYAGVVPLANDPNSAISKLPIAKKLKVREPADIQRIYLCLGDIDDREQADQGAGQPGGRRHRLEGEQRDRRRGNEPGKFTAFCAYEWTSTPRQHEHAPQRLLQGLREGAGDAVQLARFAVSPKTCGTGWTGSASAATSCSRSRTTRTSPTASCSRPTSTSKAGRSTQAWAESRDRNERLIEIKQIKGQSETHPLLSPNDEFANYEILTLPARRSRGPVPDDPRQLRRARR